MESVLGMFKLAASCTNNGVLPGLYDGLCDAAGTVNITALSDVMTIIGNVIRILVALSGGLAVIFIIIGGIYYVISAGDPARLKRAKEILTQALVGLLLIGFAYAIVTFVVRTLNG